ncbi:MAG TPA: methanogenesis marker 16 metalloprotein [Methanosarcinales archaeon]|nr:methanogenesis marker 16 metalloprotein [Methanosarcinales archaeon]
MERKSIDEINKKIKRGEAVVCTAEEFKEKVRNDELVTVDTVDVVTCATCGIMSGTAAILQLQIAGKARFERAERVWLNGVPAHPGPCPNERLDVVDVIVYGTAHANSGYGGGHLFRELVEGEVIEAKVETIDKMMIEREVTINDMKFARIFGVRMCFKNYMGFLNPVDGTVKTIFSVNGMKGPYREISVSGCGELNPLENDPMLKTIGVGTRVLVNGAIGYVIGEGTRSSKERPNLSVVADMYGMDPIFMGGFVTSCGPECITSIAVPIPVTDEEVISNLSILDEDIKLPIADIMDRVPFAESNYASVWQDLEEIEFDAERCCNHDICNIEDYCPTNAFSRTMGIDRERCFNCGACIASCPGDVSRGGMGHVEIDGRTIPITLRQSDRSRAKRLSERLKRMILKGDFLMAKPVDYLRNTEK